MRFVFDLIERIAPTGLVLHAIVGSAIGIALLLAFILLRRAYRQRQFRLREERTLVIRQRWEGVLDGSIAPGNWRFDPLDRDIVETILLDRLEVAPPSEADRLVRCLRVSGLLDRRIFQARQSKGWRRRQALLALGRMRMAEVIPALAEALEDFDAETRIAAVRGLGRTALPAAAVPILERFSQRQLRVPATPLQNALVSCCRPDPCVLLPYLRKADDTLRPLLARVVGEVASAELDEDLLLLASDPLGEVRASAARALAHARPHLALMALGNLAADEEWFVRLRAVVSLGELREPRAIPILIDTLCDQNRHVRLRSAAALAQMETHLEEIIELALQTRDRYAVQALVSALERSGGILQLVNTLTDPARRSKAEAALLAALRAGTQRMLLDALVHHTNWRVRLAVARLLARSGERQLVPQVELLDAAVKSRRQRRVTSWVLRQLRGEDAAGPKLEVVLN